MSQSITKLIEAKLNQDIKNQIRKVIHLILRQKKEKKEEKIAIAFCSAFGPHAYRKRLGFCTYREKEAE